MMLTYFVPDGEPMARRRTLKRYVELYRNPQAMYPGNAIGAHGPVSVTLYPNGEPEIWIQTPDGLGVRIHAGNGPAGLGLQISRFVGTPDVDSLPDALGGVELCQYRQDARSQAFRRWYRQEETPADVALLGQSYARSKS